jgi:hypothetical protein
MYEDNPDRRVHCPEWSLHICHYEKLSDIAHKHDMSRSRVFETIMQNFFLIEKPTIAIEETPAPAPKKTLRKLTLHPSVIEAIQTFSAKSRINSSRYINEALAVYFNKYNGEVDLKKLIKFM